MAEQDRDVYDKGPAKAAAPAEKPTLLDQLTDALFGAGHGVVAHQGKSVDQTVKDAMDGGISDANKANQ